MTAQMTMIFNKTASGANTNLNFSVTGVSAGGAALLDDISVEPAGVPDGGTTVMLLGTALGALAMARRFLKR